MKKLLTVALVFGLFLALLGSAGIVFAQDPVDTDGDGVADESDQCLDTPEGAEVGEDGCPLEDATAEPTEEATEEPTAEPTEEATEEPTAEPTEEATEEPTAEPTEEATEEPTAEPTEEATEEPTAEPTEEATEEPTAEPTEEATVEPTEAPVVPEESDGVQISAAPNPGVGDSEFYVQNMDGTGSVEVSAEYFGTGCGGGGACTSSKTIPPYASKRFSSTDNPAGDGWLGSVVLSAGGEVGAVTNLFWENKSRGGTYSGVSEGAVEIFYPFLSAAVNQSQTSSLAVQNAGDDTANITITYYNRDGSVCGSPVVQQNVAAGAQVTFDLEDYPSSKLPDFDACISPDGTWRGAAKASSSEPLAGVGIVHWQNYSGAYNAFSVAEAQTSLNLSSVYRRSRGGWYQNSNITVQNLCTDRAANVTVRFYDETGAQVASLTDQIPALSSHAYNTRAGGDVPASTFNSLGDWYIGPAQAESTGSSPCPIVAVALTQWWVDDFAGIQNSATSGYQELFVPEVDRKRPSGWTGNTAIVLQNLSDSDATVNLYFYDQNGTQKLLIQNHVIAGNAAVPFNTRSGGVVDKSVFDALGTNFTGSARITSNQPLLGIVNTRWTATGDEKASQWNMIGR